MKELYKVIKDNKYKIVHIHQNSASMAMDAMVAKLCHVPMVIGHSHNTSCNILWQHYLLKPIVNCFLNRRFACSKEAGEWIFGKRKDVRIVHNAINTEKFYFNATTRDKYRAEMNLIDKHIVGFVGRLSEQKNVIRLLQIFKCLHTELENSVLMVVGDGELRSEMEQYVIKNNLSDSVLFLGRREDVANIMSVMDVFLMPSLYEGLPVVTVEAQAAGLGLIVSNKVPVPKITKNVISISLEESDKKWVEKINELLQIKRVDTKKNIQQSGYDIKIEAKKLERFYLKKS